MNPWRSLRREIDGAVRSIRYDLSTRQTKRATRRDTPHLPPAGQRSGRHRRRFYTVAAAVLLPVAGVSGYLAVTSGFDALFPGESSPNGLPGTSLEPDTPDPSSAASGAVQPAAIDDPRRGRPAPRTSPVPVVPTLPTPAPSCQCTSTPPPPTPAPTPSPSTSPVNSASPWPTISTPQGGPLSPRPTRRSMP